MKPGWLSTRWYHRIAWSTKLRGRKIFQSFELAWNGTAQIITHPPINFLVYICGFFLSWLRSALSFCWWFLKFIIVSGCTICRKDGKFRRQSTASMLLLLHIPWNRFDSSSSLILYVLEEKWEKDQCCRFVVVRNSLLTPLCKFGTFSKFKFNTLPFFFAIISISLSPNKGFPIFGNLE